MEHARYTGKKTEKQQKIKKNLNFFTISLFFNHLQNQSNIDLLWITCGYVAVHTRKMAILPVDKNAISVDNLGKTAKNSY